MQNENDKNELYMMLLEEKFEGRGDKKKTLKLCFHAFIVWKYNLSI